MDSHADIPPPRVEQPALDALLRRLSECPAEFLAEPRSDKHPDGVNVRAVLHDLLEDLGDAPSTATLDALETVSARKALRNVQRTRLVAAWLLHDPSLRVHTGLAPRALAFLQSIESLAGLVSAELFVRDPDRREELARTALHALGLRPAGESEAHAADRLQSLSSVERDRVIRATRAAEENARALRKKMEEEAAKAAAARYSSE
jgi:hypothetical protein